MGGKSVGEITNWWYSDDPREIILITDSLKKVEGTEDLTGPS